MELNPRSSQSSVTDPSHAHERVRDINYTHFKSLVHSGLQLRRLIPSQASGADPEVVSAGDDSGYEGGAPAVSRGEPLVSSEVKLLPSSKADV